MPGGVEAGIFFLGGVEGGQGKRHVTSHRVHRVVDERVDEGTNGICNFV